MDVDSWLTTETATLDELVHEESERVVALLLNVMSAHWLGLEGILYDRE